MINPKNIKPTAHGNSGITVFEYKGQKALQVLGVEDAFSELAIAVADSPFDLIVELGTDFGGLTNLLADHEISSTASIQTYDIEPDRFISDNDKINFHNKNVFEYEDEIASLIQKASRCLLLCDGGNKEHEFRVFHQYLKPNDVIMAHDYAASVEDFVNRCQYKIWNWHEFQDEYANFVGLEPFLQDVFKEYAWCIRKVAGG